MARTDIKELDLFIENKMKALKMPGLTVAIRGPEGVIFEKGYGVRDREMSVAPDENTICLPAIEANILVGRSISTSPVMNIYHAITSETNPTISFCFRYSYPFMPSPAKR